MLNTEKEIARSIAEILWADAWASHVEESDACTADLSGCEITDHMPEVPQEAIRYAYRVIGRVEQAGGRDILSLFASALRADGIGWENSDGYVHRFGNCLGYMTHGHGVSWFDDHCACPALSKATDVYMEACDLRVLAEQNCEDCPC